MMDGTIFGTHKEKIFLSFIKVIIEKILLLSGHIWLKFFQKYIEVVMKMYIIYTGAIIHFNCQKITKVIINKGGQIIGPML